MVFLYCFLRLNLKTRILAARSAPTMVPVTLPPETSSPPSWKDALTASCTSEPMSPASFSTRITSPGATRYCFPPVSMIACMQTSLLGAGTHEVRRHYWSKEPIYHALAAQSQVVTRARWDATAPVSHGSATEPLQNRYSAAGRGEEVGRGCAWMPKQAEAGETIQQLVPRRPKRLARLCFWRGLQRASVKITTQGVAWTAANPTGKAAQALAVRPLREGTERRSGRRRHCSAAPINPAKQIQILRFPAGRQADPRIRRRRGWKAKLIGLGGPHGAPQ